MIVPLAEEAPAPQKQLLLESLDQRWNTYRAELQRCHIEFSIDAIHDVRVALRRLLSLVRLLNSIEPNPRFEKLRRAFKNQLNEFDELRDTQVMLEEIARIKAELPQLEYLQEYLEKIEGKLLVEIRMELETSDLMEIEHRILLARESLTAEEKADWTAPIFQSVDEAFSVTKQRFDQIEPTHPATIHRVRTAFKNFRYLVEIIHPLLQGFPENNLKLMNKYQTMMGEIQDNEVFLKTLDELLERAPSFDLELVRGHYEVRRSDAVSAFIKKKNMLKKFWRLTPEKPFPWEATK
jgi:CHAD domain-containing protein